MMHYFQRYLQLSACYGFYRGWIADYRYNRYDADEPITPYKYDLMTEAYTMKLARGIINASMYGTFGNGIALYNLVSRMEINLLNKNPYEHVNAYSEVFDSTTLVPQKCKM